LLRQQAPAPAFVGAVSAWLDALIAEATGNVQAALVYLRQAVESESIAMPLYRAHMLIDHARVAARLKFHDVANSSRAQALRIYASLGAQGYVDRESADEAAGPPPPSVDAFGLSDREKEVLRLVVLGFSYAQISRDLFISRSTVGFHLSNIYAKTNVSTRHELTALVRAEPAEFGALAIGA
jgi:DNA-binding CsgD family transcriptional regulator